MATIVIFGKIVLIIFKDLNSFNLTVSILPFVKVILMTFKNLNLFNLLV